MMLHHFEYNGEDSRDYGVYILSHNVYDKPKKGISFISVPGRNGDLIIDNGGYENLKITLTLRLFAKKIIDKVSDLEYAYYNLLNWLQQTATYYPLIFSYDENYYREACINSGIRILHKFKDIIDLTVTFSCKPFKKSFYGDKKIIMTSSTMQLFNPELYVSKPYMKIIPVDGTEDFSIAVNNVTYSFYRADGYVEIDSDTMNVFKGTVNKNNDYAATSFPEFKAGTNSIAKVGNISSIEIIPRWRTI